MSGVTKVWLGALKIIATKLDADQYSPSHSMTWQTRGGPSVSRTRTFRRV